MSKRELKIKLKAVLIVLSLFIVLTGVAKADERSIYGEGIDYLKQGLDDFALLKFNQIVTAYPRSEYAEKAQLKVIEYFHVKGVNEEASRGIAKYYELFPQGKNIETVKEIAKEIESRNINKRGKDIAVGAPPTKLAKKNSLRSKEAVIKDTAAELGISEEQLLQDYDNFWKSKN